MLNESIDTLRRFRRRRGSWIDAGIVQTAMIEDSRSEYTVVQLNETLVNL